MTSRERVLTAFEHLEPDRVPTWCGASSEFWTKAKRRLNLDDEGLRIRFGDDFRRIHSRYNGPEFKLPAGIACRTPFGVERNGFGYGQPISHPLTNASIKDVHEYPWPDPNWWDVSHLHGEAAQCVCRGIPNAVAGEPPVARIADGVGEVVAALPIL